MPQPSKPIVRVLPLVNFADDRLRDDWNGLARQCVFQSWDWCATWWKHYGQADQSGYRDAELQALLVLDDATTGATNKSAGHSGESETAGSRVVAIAPWFLCRSRRWGRTIRFLGTGEVCADHLTIPIRDGYETPAAEALASYLAERASDWDVLQLDAVDDGDGTIGSLLDALVRHGCHWTVRESVQCWRIPLPDSWDVYLERLSKSHRKQLRRLDRKLFASERAQWHLAGDTDEFDKAWDILVDLHQQRRDSLGESGCFASPLFHSFHRELAETLLDRNQLRLSWIELDGAPVAAEYDFADTIATRSYQSGICPEHADTKPGSLSMIRTIQQAIAENHSYYDLLRGNEPYKAHWRAEPRRTFCYQIVPDRTAARFRHRANDTVNRVARWVQGGLGIDR